jgi:hypothetical protein
MPPTNHFLSNDSCILFSKVCVAIFVVEFFLNPNCSGANKLFSVKYKINLLYIIFSIFFEKEGISEIGR